MAPVTLHYWAGARAAAGTKEETFVAETVRQALRLAEAAHDDPRFARVIAACSLLIDGLAVSAADLDRPLTGPVTVEVLPPFAGGAVSSRLAQGTSQP
jgi:molybdopterin converting factor small subunit